MQWAQFADVVQMFINYKQKSRFIKKNGKKCGACVILSFFVYETDKMWSKVAIKTFRQFIMENYSVY